MLLKIFEYIFIASGILFCIFLIMHKAYVSKLNDNMKKSDYVACLAVLLSIYILSAVITGVMIPDWYKKVLMLLFAISPFIIGKIATYEKEKMYTGIQIISIVISAAFVLIFS